MVTRENSLPYHLSDMSKIYSENNLRHAGVEVAQENFPHFMTGTEKSSKFDGLIQQQNGINFSKRFIALKKTVTLKNQLKFT